MPQIKSLVYTGASQTPFEGLNTSYIETTGTKNATNAGTYSCTLKLKKISGYTIRWNDSTFVDKTITWKIEKKVIAIPTPKTTVFIYDGANHTLEFNDWNSYSSYVTSECSSEKNAGTYECALKLKDTANLSWVDGTTSNKTIKWNIITPGVEEYDPSTDTNLGKTIIFTYKDTNNKTQTSKWKIAERLYKDVYAIQAITYGGSPGLGQSDYDLHKDFSFVAGGMRGSYSSGFSVPSYMQSVEASGGRNSTGTYSPNAPQNHCYLVPSTLIAPPKNLSIAESSTKTGYNYYLDAMKEALNQSQYNDYAILANPCGDSTNRAYWAVNKSGGVTSLSVEGIWYYNHVDQYPAFNLDISKVSIDASGNVTIK